MLSSSLNLHWAFGFSKDKVGGVQSLCQKDRNALFFLSSHSGVIYDFEQRTQTVLQGHCNIITCCAVDKSKRFIVTADSGIDPIIIVWDAISCVPVKTFYNPHEIGIDAIDISDDALFIATLSSCDPDQAIEQEISVWSWTTDDSEPLLRQKLSFSDYYHVVKFNPSSKNQLVTTGAKSISYWNWDDLRLEHYIGVVSKTDLGNFSGRFVSTIFLPSTENCITATSDGYVVVWENKNDVPSKKSSNTFSTMKIATKVLRLVECGITSLIATSNDYLAIACDDGAVRFYDYFLRLEAWFEDLSVGSITSLTFSVQQCPFAPGEGGAPGLKFWVPDFLVGTADAFVVGVESSLFEEVRKEDRRGTLLMQGMAEEVAAVACHPSLPLVAVTCSNSILHIWNYDIKLLMILREFNGGIKSDEKRSSHTRSRTMLKSKCLSFDSTGSALVIGFASGVVKVLRTESLEDVSTFSSTTDAILDIKFSPSGMYFACFDSGHHVLIFKRVQDEGINARKGEDSLMFQFIGRAASHKAPIVGIAYGMKDIVETLVSVSEDKHCVEYDLKACSISAGVVAVKTVCSDGNPHASHRLDIFAKPTALMWYPRTDFDVEDRFLVANDEFKLKEYNIDSKLCRKTTIAPRFGTPPVTLLQVPAAAEDSAGYFAFSAASRVIGIGTFPLSGDPSKVMGIVAHPGKISALAVSCEGKYLFSAGGPDLSVNMWRVEPAFESVRPSHSAGSPHKQLDSLSAGSMDGDLPKMASSLEMQPFFSLLEGGEGGDLHNDIVDYFYYCQLRHIGEDTMDPRDLNGLIPLEEIPSLVRAIGYYPSEDEVVNMMNEVRYRNFVRTGQTEQFINLEDFIKLYINHRPVLPLDKQSIAAAFQEISNSLGMEDRVSWGSLCQLLQGEGEAMTPQDLDSFLLALIGSDSGSIQPDAAYNAPLFAEQILGFEPEEEGFVEQ